MNTLFGIDNYYRENFNKIRTICRDRDKLLIFMHNYPDPDSIASAYILSMIVKKWKVKTKIVYGGELTRPENIELVRSLKIVISLYQAGEEKNYQLTALVDTQKGMKNNVFPLDVEPDFVFDHHEVKLKENFHGKGVSHIDKKIGANASILMKYYQHLNGQKELDQKIATLYCYALSTETKELSMGATQEEIIFYKWAYRYANLKTLAQIKHIKRPYSFLSIFSNAMQNYQIVDNVLYSDLGVVDRYDCLPEIADFFISITHIHFVVVTGWFNNKYFASARTAHTNINMAKILQKSLKNHGKAGGHGAMAAAEFNAKPKDFISAFIRETQKYLMKLS